MSVWAGDRVEVDLGSFGADVVLLGRVRSVEPHEPGVPTLVIANVVLDGDTEPTRIDSRACKKIGLKAEARRMQTGMEL